MENGPMFLAELKRRRVFRVATVYAAAGFVVWQAADIAFPALGLPEWLVTAVVAVTLVGFPLALVLAWAFDITPDGVLRTDGGGAGGSHVVVSRATLRTQRIAAAGGLLVLALAGAAFLAFGGRDDEVDAGIDRSIAVLPFANLSGDAENEYFSDGITDEILTQLAKVGELRVISRTSIMSYKGTMLRLGEIADQLGVAHILEGSVRRDGDRVRVSAQLIDARADRHLWAETYDHELTGLFRIQSDIAQQIARALRAQLSPAEQARIAAAGTTDLAAYDLYLRAREHNQGFAEDGNRVAITKLEQALAQDPGFAAAWAELARAYAPLGATRPQLDTALTYALKAVELDPELAVAHSATGTVFRRLGRLTDAAAAYRRAYELSPSDVVSIGGLGWAHDARGEWAEGLRWRLRAAALDPTTSFRHRQVAFSYQVLGDHGEAERALTAAARLAPDETLFQQDLMRLHLERGDLQQAAIRLQIIHGLAPDRAESFRYSGRYELARGDTAAAIAHYERALALDPSQPPALELAFLFWQRGEHDRADEILRVRERAALAAIAEGAEDYRPAHELARIHGVRGDADGVARWLEEARRRHALLQGVDSDPLLAGVREDPRVAALLAAAAAERERQRQLVVPGP
jgi:adenylate cyclase